MGIIPNGIVVISKDKSIVDYAMESGYTLITECYHMDRNIVLLDDGSDVKIVGKKMRKKITSIDELKDAFEGYVAASTEILSRYTPFIPENIYTYPDFSGLKRDLLVEQLVFDVLFDKYLEESELMTRNRYATFMSEKLYTDSIQRIDCSRAIYENLARGMKTDYDRMRHTKLREQLEVLGIDPDNYDKYYNPKLQENKKKEKPKFFWDCLYYNFGRNLQSPILDDDNYPRRERERGMITSRQYRRQFTRDSRNYSYEEMYDDLKKYNDFVNKILPAENESYRKYFDMSMDYYALESYKRIDFMCKLIRDLAETEILISEINKEHFLVRRFVPRVLIPRIQNNEVYFGWRKKYYRPILIIEERMHEEMQNEAKLDQKYYEALLLKHQYVRAKAYELFKYNAEFELTDYCNAKKFLVQSYNMRKYHESNDIWKVLKDANWVEKNSDEKSWLKDIFKSIISMNQAFFWDLPD